MNADTLQILTDMFPTHPTGELERVFEAQGEDLTLTIEALLGQSDDLSADAVDTEPGERSTPPPLEYHDDRLVEDEDDEHTGARDVDDIGPWSSDGSEDDEWVAESDAAENLAPHIELHLGDVVAAQRPHCMIVAYDHDTVYFHDLHSCAFDTVAEQEAVEPHVIGGFPPAILSRSRSRIRRGTVFPSTRLVGPFSVVLCFVMPDSVPHQQVRQLFPDNDLAPESVLLPERRRYLHSVMNPVTSETALVIGHGPGSFCPVIGQVTRVYFQTTHTVYVTCELSFHERQVERLRVAQEKILRWHIESQDNQSTASSTDWTVWEQWTMRLKDKIQSRLTVGDFYHQAEQSAAFQTSSTGRDRSTLVRTTYRCGLHGLTLYPFQADTFEWMWRQEQMPYSTTQNLWHALPHTATGGNEGCYYSQTLQTVQFQQLEDMRGGIVANDMGLGKTVNAYALIAHDWMQRHPNECTNVPAADSASDTAPVANSLLKEAALARMRRRQQQQPPVAAEMAPVGAAASISEPTTSAQVPAAKRRRVHPRTAAHDSSTTTTDTPAFALDNYATLILVSASSMDAWLKILRDYVHVPLKVLRLDQPKVRNTVTSEMIRQADIVFCTTTVISRMDMNHLLFKTHWYRVVLDEGHLLRNVNTEMSKRLQHSIQTKRRWILTGTPIYKDDLLTLRPLLEWLRIPGFEPLVYWQDAARLTRSAHLGCNSRQDRFIAGLLQVSRQVMCRVNPNATQVAQVPRSFHVHNVPWTTSPAARQVYTHAQRYVTEELRESQAKQFLQTLSPDHLRTIIPVDSSTQQPLTAGVSTKHLMRYLRVACSIMSDTEHTRTRISLASLFNDTNNTTGTSDEHRVIPTAELLYAAADDVCSVCKDEFVLPMQLGCGHVCCLVCVKDLFKHRHRACPMCRAPLEKELIRKVVWRREPTGAESDAVEDNDQEPQEEEGDEGQPPVMHAKLQYLIDHLRPLTGQEKCVVFSDFPQSLAMIEEALQEAEISCARLNPGLSSDERHELLEQFRTEPNLQCLLLPLTRSSVGMTLICATRLIFFEPSASETLELQAIKRIHRIGQTQPVTIEWLSMQGSIESTMMQCRYGVPPAEDVCVQALPDSLFADTPTRANSTAPGVAHYNAQELLQRHLLH